MLAHLATLKGSPRESGAMPRLRAHQEPAPSATTQVSALLERPGRCSIDRRSTYRAHARTGPREARLHRKDPYERFALAARPRRFPLFNEPIFRRKVGWKMEMSGDQTKFSVLDLTLLIGSPMKRRWVACRCPVNNRNNTCTSSSTPRAPPNHRPRTKRLLNDPCGTT